MVWVKGIVGPTKVVADCRKKGMVKVVEAWRQLGYRSLLLKVHQRAPKSSASWKLARKCKPPALPQTH